MERFLGSVRAYSRGGIISSELVFSLTNFNPRVSGPITCKVVLVLQASLCLGFQKYSWPEALRRPVFRPFKRNKTESVPGTGLRHFKIEKPCS